MESIASLGSLKRSADNSRLKVTVRGAVQGVGFRPFVYRIAKELHLAGWVSNSQKGVTIEVEGPTNRLERFLFRIELEKPVHSRITSLEFSVLDPAGFHSFEIRPSDTAGNREAFVMPDIATCGDCLQEIFDPANRRYRYPFTNCTHCGPRFSIVEALPYDRARTSMSRFQMCASCRREYEDPSDRRFHAEANACPDCGPKLELWDREGVVLARGHASILLAADAVRQGRIVALKGLGGFHLLADASNGDAVRTLRQRKEREEKPLALMFPSLDRVEAFCVVSHLEERLLRAPESPIVLLRRKKSRDDGISNSVAPGNPAYGVMLPYTPLHHLLMAELNFPVVATSGNRSDEPICKDEKDALERLNGIADRYLVHDRPILRHIDDSIVRVILGREQILRRARGYAPLPVWEDESVLPILAVGGHLKNTVAVSVGREAVLSQHIGDLETPQACQAFENEIKSLLHIHDIHPAKIACDPHPDYISTQYAAGLGGGVDVQTVQHHYAHILSCMADNGLTGDVLGVAWDGSGYGEDGTLWGGEFLTVNDESHARVAHLRAFSLPGGAQAVREPRRGALGILHEIFGPGFLKMKDIPSLACFDGKELENLSILLGSGAMSPRTSSAGRLFDAVASLVGLRQVSRYEGQAAMELEFAAYGEGSRGPYELPLRGDPSSGKPVVLDWEPMVRAILEDMRAGVPAGSISAGFHLALVGGIVSAAKLFERERVVISGGCFQNRILCESAVEALRGAGFKPYWHQRVPPNDGGLSLGQLAAVVRSERSRKASLTL